MGLFGNALKNAINKAVDNTIGAKLEETIRDNFDVELKDKGTNFTIPSEYDSFPKFEGTLKSGTEKSTSNYKRVMLNYNTDELAVSKYRELLLENGYSKATSIRYEKAKTYVIVNLDGSNLELVYHIKK